MNVRHEAVLLPCVVVTLVSLLFGGIPSAAKADSDVDSVLVCTDILGFLDGCLNKGSLTGCGEERNAKRQLQLMRMLLEGANVHIKKQRTQDACCLLNMVYKRCDGDGHFEDWVKGEATEELANMINELRSSLDCM